MFSFSRKKSEYGNIYFRDPLLEMGYLGRFTVRVITNAWVIVHVVVTVVFLLTDIPWAFWLGVLSSLYLLDRLLHYSRPEEYLPSEGDEYGNLALYLSPRAKRSVISAYNRAIILGGGFFLNLLRALSETKSILEMLARLEINDKEFNAKLDVYLGKDLVSYRDKERLLGEIEQLIFVAFSNREKGQRNIDYADLFVALGDTDNEQLVSLFRVFEINGESLRGVASFGKLINRFKPFHNKHLLKSSYNLFKDVDLGDDEQISAIERVLFRKVLELEKKYKIFVVYSSVITAVKLAEKYFHDKPILNSAENLMSQAVIYVSKRGDDIVRSDDILATAERVINTPKPDAQENLSQEAHAN